MSILHNPQAIEIIREAADKLRAIGLVCWMTPTDMQRFGGAVSLHVGETELAAAAAAVAMSEGSNGAHEAGKPGEQFANLVADFIATEAVLKASGGRETVNIKESSMKITKITPEKVLRIMKTGVHEEERDLALRLTANDDSEAYDDKLHLELCDEGKGTYEPLYITLNEDGTWEASGDVSKLP